MSSPAPSPAARRLRAEDRREQIMEAAAHLFTERGFEGVGMADIATALGTSRPTIYAYFQSTAEILDALLDERLAHLPERLRPHLSAAPVPSFRDLFLALVQEKELLRLLNSGGGPLFRTRRAAFIDTVQERLELRQRGQNKAAAQGRAPQPLLLPILLNLLSSVAYEHVCADQAQRPQQTEELAAVLDSFIQGGVERLFEQGGESGPASGRQKE